MSTSMADFNQNVIAEFRANGGKVGGIFEHMPIVLVHHTGAKSGETRVAPLAVVEDDGRYVIFATKAGAPTNPAWYHNLMANPRTEIEVGTDTIEVTATEATGDERDRLYATIKDRSPQFAEYEAKTTRTIPVVILTPAG